MLPASGTGGVGGPKIEIEELVSISADLSAIIPKIGIEELVSISADISAIIPKIGIEL